MFQLTKKGFTLIELLVVISIIAILMAFAVASFSNAQIKARDSRRISDMKNIQAAMEQAYTTAGVYPDIVSGSPGGANGTCTATAAILPQLSPFPVDPKASNPVYQCDQDSNANPTTYCACANLEGTAGGNSTATADNTCSGINASASGNGWFCVRNKQ